MNIIDDALKFATEQHQGQFRRKTGKEYITHPIHVAELLRKYKTSKNIESLVSVCLLHDVQEDCEVSNDEIRTRFGDLIANLVDEMTSDDEQIKIIGKTNYLMLKLVSMSSYGLTIKLVDRLSNVMDCPSDNYKKSTIQIIQYLRQNRNMNKTQSTICLDILLECI
jgi:guanosine-3',5'-bis(diphosphate) 3'-pyrophosphohydrolase